MPRTEFITIHSSLTTASLLTNIYQLFGMQVLFSCHTSLTQDNVLSSHITVETAKLFSYLDNHDEAIFLGAVPTKHTTPLQQQESTGNLENCAAVEDSLQQFDVVRLTYSTVQSS